jgi:hypothetical protein
MERQKHLPDFVIKSQTLNKHIKRLKDKDRSINQQINKLC